MSFEHRLFDDEGFAPPGTPEIIPIVDILLERLDLESSSHAEQVAEIRKWLQANQPSKSLVRDLERSEFANTLDVLS